MFGRSFDSPKKLGRTGILEGYSLGGSTLARNYPKLFYEMNTPSHAGTRENEDLLAIKLTRWAFPNTNKLVLFQSNVSRPRYYPASRSPAGATRRSRPICDTGWRRKNRAPRGSMACRIRPPLLDRGPEFCPVGRVSVQRGPKGVDRKRPNVHSR